MSIWRSAVRIEGAGPARVGPSPEKEHHMKQYLLSMYQPVGDPPPPDVLQSIMQQLSLVQDEMKAAGSFVFTDGLEFPDAATVVRVKDGELLMTDGPFIEGKEHLGGFYIIKAADLDAALEWARKVTLASTLPIEVRPMRTEVED
jgi:hypothetical protein